MIDELQSAAERVRTKGYSLYDCFYKSGLKIIPYELEQEMIRQRNSYERDVVMLANAYLANSPADDGEPITGKLLESLGGRRPMAVACDEVYSFGEYTRTASGMGWWPVQFVYHESRRDWDVSVFGSALPKRFATRGEVRQLLRALSMNQEQTQ